MLMWLRCTGDAALPPFFGHPEQDTLLQRCDQVEIPWLQTGRGRQADAAVLAQEARDSLRDCGAIAGEDGGWRAVWQAETEAASRARSSADQLREAVHFQVPRRLPGDVSKTSWNMVWRNSHSAVFRSGKGLAV